LIKIALKWTHMVACSADWSTF